MLTTVLTKSLRTPFLTPNQLAELKKGPKTSIVIGPADDRFIGLEGASVNLLANFSPLAKQKLVVECGNVLCIPNGAKKAILWIYKFMQADEKDPQGLMTFEALNFDNLVELYQHCAFLEYSFLMARIPGRLRGKFFEVFPTVKEIKIYQTSIPSLYDYAIRALSGEMVRPWACGFASNLKLVERNAAFGKALGEALRELVDSRVKIGEEYYRRADNRQMLWSKKHLEKALSGATIARKLEADTEVVRAPKRKSKSPIKCYRCDIEGHMARNYTAEAEPVVTGVPAVISVKPVRAKKSREPFACFKCGGEGHISGDCTAEVQEAFATEPIKKTAGRPAPICYNCNGSGHISRNCTDPKPREEHAVLEGGEGIRPPPNTPQPSRKPKVQKSFLCYNCGGDGHMARNCTAEVSPIVFVHTDVTTRPARNTTGRNKHFRRAQLDRETSLIDVADNGEGIRTCDREVRKGEKTYTGLII